MPDSFRTCLTSLHKLVKKLLKQLKVLNKVKSWKGKKPERLASDFSWLTPSFAATDVSGQLKHVFKFFDANGDGKISSLELSEVLLSLGHEKSMATKEAEGMVREMDCNGDGFVDFDEFMSVIDVTSKEDDLKEVFLMFDTDKNGFISAKELQRVLVSIGCDNCSLKECRRMINGVDRDGNGLVDFEEFKAMMSAGCLCS